MILYQTLSQLIINKTTLRTDWFSPSALGGQCRQSVRVIVK